MDKTNMPEEVLDLVTEKDEIIGEVLKKDANSNPELIHREVGVVLYNDANEVLIQQRSHKKKVHPGVWAVGCAGHVPKGMTPEDAAHMELQEELGFDVEKIRFVDKILDKIPTETRFLYLYVGRYSGAEFLLEENEVEQVRWISEDDFEDFLRDNEMPVSSAEINRRFWKENWSGA